MSDRNAGDERPGAEGEPPRLRDLPGFVRFWTASTTSVFGTYVTTLALQVLIVVTLKGSAFDVGLVNAARWLPYAAAGLVVGALVDRFRRRPVLVATDIGRGVLLVAIPVLAILDRLSIPVLIAFMVVFGAMSLVNDAAFQSFLPRLVPRELLGPANARLDQSSSVAQTSGPALAGGLVAVIGAPFAVLVDAASYLGSGLVLLTVRTPEPAANAPGLRWRQLRGEVAEGLRWVYRHPTLGPSALTTHGWFLFSGILGAVIGPFALVTMRMGAVGYGLVLAASGVGALAGSLVATWLGRVVGVGPTVIGSRALEGLAIAVMALAPATTGGDWAGWLMVGVGELLLGLGMGAENPNEMGYRQAATPDRLQGRTNGTIRSLNRAMVVVGAPLGGLIGATAGPRPAMWCAAAGILLVTLVLGLSRFRHASYSDPVATPD